MKSPRFTVAALTILAACSSERGGSVHPTLAAVDSLVAESMRDGKVPGLALTIVRNDSVIHSRGYGFADLEQQIPMTDSTPVVIGSTSKTITSFAIMQLVDEGKVALDTPAVRYLKVARSATPADSRFTAITARHLLTNASGLPKGFSGDPFIGIDTTSGALERLVRDDMLPRTLDFAPGKGFVYSNRGFSLASLVVQDASGESYESYVARRIFEPFGMRHTTGEFWRGESMGRTQGYRETTDGKPVPRLPSTSREWTGSGMITSTSADIGRYLRALLAGGKAADGTQVLSEPGVAELLRPQYAGESELGGPTMYALGWETTELNGVPVIMKAGSVITMGSLFVMLPKQRVGFALMFNLPDYGKVQLVRNLMLYLVGEPTAPYQAVPTPAPVPVVHHAVSPARLQTFAGDYMTRFGRLSVQVRSDSARAWFEGNDARLEASSDSTFIVRSELREQEGMELTFRRCGATMCIWLRGDSSGVRLQGVRPSR